MKSEDMERVSTEPKNREPVVMLLMIILVVFYSFSSSDAFYL